MARVDIDHSFSSSSAQVFAYMAEHENLATVFGARVTRVCDGSDGVRNGVGSTRRVKVGPLPAFEESVTEFLPHLLIRYRMSHNSPIGSVVTDHEGVMRFSVTAAGGTRLQYVIIFHARIPGVAPVAARLLQHRMAAALVAIEASLVATPAV
jgi:Polyketide cyclase / dehydrase and lipid transport